MIACRMATTTLWDRDLTPMGLTTLARYGTSLLLCALPNTRPINHRSKAVCIRMWLMSACTSGWLSPELAGDSQRPFLVAAWLS